MQVSTVLQACIDFMWCVNMASKTCTHITRNLSLPFILLKSFKAPEGQILSWGLAIFYALKCQPPSVREREHTSNPEGTKAMEASSIASTIFCFQVFICTVPSCLGQAVLVSHAL